MEKLGFFLVCVGGWFFACFLGGFEVLILKMKDVRIVYFLVKFSVVLDVRNEDVHLLVEDVHLLVGSNDRGLELCYCGFCVRLCIHHRR